MPTFALACARPPSRSPARPLCSPTCNDEASRKRKADNAPPTETEPVEEPREPAAKKARIRPNMRPPPPPEPEPEPEHEHEPEPEPERAAPTVPAIPTSNIAPQDEVINISSSDPPEAGSSRAPITVSSSDPPDGANVDATPNTAGLRVVHARKMKVPVPPAPVQINKLRKRK
ncbi:hypothetical protein FS749_010546 [Ceratobasidium sp. UAMH 11750]|nr:hypothetical protein FS749_010546 [Ceratobasidium sp. UAMH 11750]